MALTFQHFSGENYRRCVAVFHDLEDWSPQDWCLAMCGEAGEAANFLKKARRGESIPIATIGAEIADVVTYADLLAQRLGLDLGTIVAKKFAVVSEREGYKQGLLMTSESRETLLEILEWARDRLERRQGIAGDISQVINSLDPSKNPKLKLALDA